MSPCPSRERASRGGFTLIEVLIVLAIIGVLAALAQPAYKKYRDYAMTRSCHAQQKTIAGAIQSYNLDHNTSRTDLPAVIDVLIEKRLLQERPNDPGGGPNSWSNYQTNTGGFNIKCSVHGAIPTGP